MSYHWAACGIGLALLAVPYAAVLPRLFNQWLLDPEMAHAPLVPCAIVALLVHRRARLAGIAPDPSAWGIPLLLAGLIGFAGSLSGAGLFVGSAACLVSAGGVILVTLGSGLFAAMAGPLALTVFLLPRLALLYDPLTNPLARISAAIATATLRGAFGIDAASAGSLVSVAGFPILVGESCSGLRFLVPLLFVAALLIQFRPLSMPRRAAVILLAATFPLAVLANALRVGILVYLASSRGGNPPESAHTWLGYLLYALALVLLLKVGQASWPVPVRTVGRPILAASAFSTRTLQFTTALFLLAATATTHGIILSAAKAYPIPQTLAPLTQFPAQLGDWVAVAEVPLDPAIRRTIAADQVVSRTYLHAPTGIQAELFLGYFASQTPTLLADREPHLPTICLPAAGWTILGQTQLPSATLLHISSGRERRDVLFWQQTPSRRFANPVLSRWYGPIDQWRLGRNDLLIARVVLPADSRAHADQLLPAIANTIQTWFSSAASPFGGSKS